VDHARVLLASLVINVISALMDIITTLLVCPVALLTIAHLTENVQEMVLASVMLDLLAPNVINVRLDITIILLVLHVQQVLLVPTAPNAPMDI